MFSDENPKLGKSTQSRRDLKPTSHARFWSVVGFEPGSTEVKGRERNHRANLISNGCNSASISHTPIEKKFEK